MSQSSTLLNKYCRRALRALTAGWLPFDRLLVIAAGHAAGADRSTQRGARVFVAVAKLHALRYIGLKMNLKMNTQVSLTFEGWTVAMQLMEGDEATSNVLRSRHAISADC